jgi:C4-dicarboxylate-specific signal transduction histidine kinase
MTQLGNGLNGRTGHSATADTSGKRLISQAERASPEDGAVRSLFNSTPLGLQYHEALLAEIERASSTGGFYWNATTDVLTCTREVYRILELDASTKMSMPLLRAHVHQDDLPFVDDMIRRSREQATGFEVQLRLRLPHQSIKHLQINARRQHSADTQLHFLGTIQDVTRRHQSEETLGNIRCELARVARISSLGAMTASIAHEVNQPLSGIMTNASICLEMLGTDSPDLDGARETVRRTIRDCERACEVIARVRALFGKQGGRTESLDLNTVTSEVIALSLCELRRRRVTLQMELAERLPLVTGDPVQLQQVILNLLLNAAEAMSGIEDRPRLLLIRTETESVDQVRLSVVDSGIGFQPQDAMRLFEAFYTTKSGGMGIGLSVSRSIIESHRGRLWAQSNAGAGATFAFSIPARRIP